MRENLGDITKIYVTHLFQPIGRQAHEILRDMVGTRAVSINTSTFSSSLRDHATAVIVAKGNFPSGILYVVQATDPQERRKELCDHNITVPLWDWIFNAPRLVLLQSTPNAQSYQSQKELLRLKSELARLLHYVPPQFAFSRTNSPRERAARFERARLLANKGRN